MSSKVAVRKMLRRSIRKSGDEIGRKMMEDLLALPLWERTKIAVNFVTKKQVFITK